VTQFVRNMIELSMNLVFKNFCVPDQSVTQFVILEVILKLRSDSSYAACWIQHLYELFCLIDPSVFSRLMVQRKLRYLH
jgi:hypothetical protein